ncbi:MULTISPECIES: NmrA family NAD(P)-binding protein [unclassified Streptomyces]|uniref:NmrA family NAD(P)-binding protein n=1 Tax=unclassified Streptomyces TaxID=2593676 RepID=UPI000DC7AEA9|nr:MULTISPECIES: NmrA family NAD(P)-binding protein [unclassified Streptomyces]AWZ09417.1 SDR family NAD(P)-dependent oxidoreductase [Streptomyces sp. ICC4]AWZ17187.1 SDR family NAD(P)-dependent oxidoreductase [Streptomyces sp. ICC1]
MATVLVTGAAGKIGSRVVTELGGRGIPVRAFVRDPDRAAAVLGGGTELAQGDFAEPESVRRALDGIDRMFLLCANDPRQVEYGTNAIDAAAAAGVRQVVMLSTIGAEAGSPTVFLDQHGRIEQHLRGSGIPAVVLRSSHMMSNVLGSAATIRQAGRFFLPAGDARIAMVDPHDVATAAAAALVTAEHDGSTHVLTGPEAITYTEVARRLSSALGRPIEYVDVPGEAAAAAMTQAGLPQWLAEQVVAVFGALRGGLNTSTTSAVRHLTGREPHTFEEFARRAAPSLAGEQPV